MGLSDGEEIMTLAVSVLIQYRLCMTVRQPDGHVAVAKTRSTHCVARVKRWGDWPGDQVPIPTHSFLSHKLHNGWEEFCATQYADYNSMHLDYLRLCIRKFFIWSDIFVKIIIILHSCHQNQQDNVECWASHVQKTYDSLRGVHSVATGTQLVSLKFQGVTKVMLIPWKLGQRLSYLSM